MIFKYKNYETDDFTENMFCNNEPCGGDHYLKIGFEGKKDYGLITFMLNSENCCNIAVHKWEFDNFREAIDVYCKIKQKLNKIVINIEVINE